MEKNKWILCPVCNSKTRLQIREDTELSGFPVGHIGVAGPGVVDDMCPEDGDLCHAFLRRLDLFR